MGAVAEELSLDPAPPVGGPNRKPRHISEVGVRQTILEDLALKTLYLSGPFSVYGLAEHMRLSFEVANELFLQTREMQFCQVTGMNGNTPVMAITSQGRARAVDLLSQ